MYKSNQMKLIIHYHGSFEFCFQNRHLGMISGSRNERTFPNIVALGRRLA
jgi:hypothetical protein